MKRKFNLIYILIILLSTSCTVNHLSYQKQQADTWFDYYVIVYDDVKSVFKNQYATLEQKKIASQKEIILIQLWPLLKSYASNIDKKIIPSNQDTQDIEILIKQLKELSMVKS